MEEHCWASQQWHPEFCHTYLGTDPKASTVRLKATKDRDLLQSPLPEADRVSVAHIQVALRAVLA